MGVDIVVHSGTKYLNGHGDTICGFVVGRNNFIDQCKMVGLKDMTGAVLGPMEAYLILRESRRLLSGWNAYSQNAMEVAKFLQFHPKVERVIIRDCRVFRPRNRQKANEKRIRRDFVFCPKKN